MTRLRTYHAVGAIVVRQCVRVRGLAGEKMRAAHSVVEKLTTLALASAAALTGKKEKRSYALVNDTWSLLVATLVGVGNSTSCPAGSGKLACWDSREPIWLLQHAFVSASAQIHMRCRVS